MTARPAAAARAPDLFSSLSVPGLVVGIDEAGRGPLAGPVQAAAVVLDPARPIAGLADSKALSEAARDRLAPEIRAHALAWAVAEASVEEIESLNILQATMLAMTRACEAVVAQLSARGLAVGLALVDGNRLPKLPCEGRAIVDGDATEPAIGAASILAKTVRDATMVALADQYPGYGFEVHKGYGTPKHLAALAELGPCPAHRRGFAPVRRALVARALARGEAQ